MKKLLALLLSVVITTFAFASAPPSADASAIISVGELKTLVDKGDKNLVLFGVINPTAALVPLSAASRPIDGSWLIWRGDYSSGNTKEAIAPEVTGYRRSQAEMENLLSRASVTPDSRIVVYAADAMHDAARFVWQLKMLGLKNVQYLDGGINAWLAAGHPHGRGTRLEGSPAQTEFKAPNYNPAAFDASFDLVKKAITSDEWVVLDSRSGDEYNGKQTSSSAGAYGTGRIAGATHINWTNAVDGKTNLLKPVVELQKIYGDALKGKKVIAYCQSGVRSAHTWLVLTEVLGATDVLNYDGSWIEWSFAASSASGGKFPGMEKLLEEWMDNKKPL